MTAKEAREITKEAIRDKKISAISDTIDLIRKTAEEGERFIEVLYTEKLLDALIELGYGVEIKHQWSDRYIKISW